MNLQRSELRELTVVEGVRQHRRNASRGTSGTFLVRLRLRGWPRIVEQQVAAMIQQVMEMNERMRWNEKVAEQARQLLETHRTARQMLEERMNRTEASVTGTFSAGGSRPGRCPRHQELTMDDSDLERLRRDTNQTASVAKTPDGLGVSYLCRTFPTWTSARSHLSSGSPTWRRSHYR